MMLEADPSRPTIAISMGDPLGIGPEVIARALSEKPLRERARFIIFGSARPMQAAAKACAITPFWDDHENAGVQLIESSTWKRSPNTTPGVDAKAGDASFRYVEEAIDAVRTHRADALVTAPINKTAWAAAGHGQWAGHTDLLAARFGAQRTRMMFVAPELRVILATAHVPLMRVCDALSVEHILETIAIGHEVCAQLGIGKPRIAVCGLNPHAGEGGALGDEDERVIVPAIRLAQQQSIDVQGPFPSDTVFNAAVSLRLRPPPRFDLVVAIYHDQGLIPVKLLAFDSAVNLTAGLGAIRTSPDHGTAFDIAGRGIADAGSMRAAIDLAIELSHRQRDTASASYQCATTMVGRPGM